MSPTSWDGPKVHAQAGFSPLHTRHFHKTTRVVMDAIHTHRRLLVLTCPETNRPTGAPARLSYRIAHDTVIWSVEKDAFVISSRLHGSSLRLHCVYPVDFSVTRTRDELIAFWSSLCATVRPHHRFVCDFCCGFRFLLLLHHPAFLFIKMLRSGDTQACLISRLLGRLVRELQRCRQPCV